MNNKIKGKGAFITQDENFYYCMKSQIADGICNDTELKISTLESEIEKVTELENAYSKNISDISGIEYFTNIKKINFNDNRISDITPLQNLRKLEELLLDGNELKNMEVIGNLINLKVLDLGYNELEIKQVEELKNLSKLEELSLACIKTQDSVDISAIFELENLQRLDLTGNLWITQDALKDIDKLEELKRLKLNACSITDLSFLNSLNLEALYLNNQIFMIENDEKILKKGKNCTTDLAPISHMTNLEEINICDSKVETLDALENIIENLACLWFERGTVRDASVVDKKKGDYDNLWATGNIICDEMEEGGIIEKEIPQIIKQAMITESALYSPEGVSLNGCEWSEVGEKVKIDTNNNYEGASITINSGKAEKTQYVIKIINDTPKKGDINLEPLTTLLASLQ